MSWTKPKKLDIKCEKCKYYYRGASLGEGGYNPFPCCHKFEETGERCNPLTFDCFKSNKRSGLK